MVNEWTDGKGADVVFEVSGVQPAVATMIDITAVRGRIVMVEIHSQKPEVDLIQFFWKELELLGTRVYQAADFGYAIELVANGDIDFDSFINFPADLPDIGSAFSTMDSNLVEIEALVACNSDD